VFYVPDPDPVPGWHAPWTAELQLGMRCVWPPPQPSSDEGLRVPVDVVVDASAPAVIAGHSRRLAPARGGYELAGLCTGPPSLCGVGVIASRLAPLAITPLGGISEWL